MKKQKIITDYFSSKKRKQKIITDFFKKKEKKICYGYNYETDSWHCTKCGLDMGINNPRQLCGKIICNYYY